MYFYVYKNTSAAAAAATKATYNDYVGDPHKLSQADASGNAPYVNDGVHDDVFDPYASLGNLDPTDLVQFAWQIACGMVSIHMYIVCVMLLRIVIPQYEYNILVITQVQGEAEDAGNN